MTEQVFTATHTGLLNVDGYIIDCAVLDDKARTRVLSQSEIVKALGRAQGGSKRGEANLPRWISARNISGYISGELMEAIVNPIVYKTVKGSRALGIDAKYLPQICTVWLKAADDGVLTDNQKETAIRANTLIRGLAHVGIIALVDEATGFQEDRDKTALRLFLEKFLHEEKGKWVKTFPDDFFESIFKMKGWNWKMAVKGQKPGVMGKYINNYVWSRIAPGVLDELGRLNPKDENGRRKGKHTQYIDVDFGHPKLKEHLRMLTMFAKASGYNWGQWERMVQRALPKFESDGSIVQELELDD